MLCYKHSGLMFLQDGRTVRYILIMTPPVRYHHGPRAVSPVLPARSRSRAIASAVVSSRYSPRVAIRLLSRARYTRTSVCFCDPPSSVIYSCIQGLCLLSVLYRKYIYPVPVRRRYHFSHTPSTPWHFLTPS